MLCLVIPFYMKIFNSQIFIPEEDITVLGNNVGMEKALCNPPISIELEILNYVRRVNSTVSID